MGVATGNGVRARNLARNDTVSSSTCVTQVRTNASTSRAISTYFGPGFRRGEKVDEGAGRARQYEEGPHVEGLTSRGVPVLRPLFRDVFGGRPQKPPERLSRRGLRIQNRQ